MAHGVTTVSCPFAMTVAYKKLLQTIFALEFHDDVTYRISKVLIHISNTAW